MASIKQWLGHFAGGRNEKALSKLINAAQADLAALKATLTTVQSDVVNVQTSVNNVITDVNNIRTQHQAVVVDLKGISNNTGSANNTYQLTAVNAAAATATAATVSSAAPSALTLTA